MIDRKYILLTVDIIYIILILVMARPKKPEAEKVITISATVVPSVDDVIRKLAQDRHWSPSKAAGILIEKGLASEGIQLPKAA